MLPNLSSLVDALSEVSVGARRGRREALSRSNGADKTHSRSRSRSSSETSDDDDSLREEDPPNPFAYGQRSSSETSDDDDSLWEEDPPNPFAYGQFPSIHGQVLPLAPFSITPGPVTMPANWSEEDVVAELVLESKAADSWSEELRLDVKMLANEVTELFQGEDAASLPTNVSRRSWSLEDAIAVKKLEDARKHDIWMAPSVPRNLRTCAQNAANVLPFDMTPDEFTALINALDAKKLLFVFSAMPIEPVQGQYKPLETGTILFLMSDSNRDWLLNQLELQGQLTLIDKVWPRIVVDYDIISTVGEKSTTMLPLQGAGSSNHGGAVDNGVVTAFDHLYDQIAKKLLRLDEQKVIKQMAYRTGLWRRWTSERGQATLKAESIAVRDDKNRDPQSSGRPRSQIYETYYTLRGALAGVSMPVYALYWMSFTNITIYQELAIADLADEFFKVGTIIRNIARTLPPTDAEEKLSKSIGAFLGRRFTSHSLALGEIGLLLTDSKPENYLLQKCYYDLEVPLPNGTSPSQIIKLSEIPIGVMATDIDPDYSFFFNHRSVGNDRHLEYFQPMGQDNQEEQSTPVPNLPPIDAECVRFCNVVIYTLSSMCRFISTNRPWTTPIYEHAGAQTARYWKAIFKIDYPGGYDDDVDPATKDFALTKMRNSRVAPLCLKLHYNIGFDQTFKDPEQGTVLKTWNSEHKYSSARVFGDKFDAFIYGLSQLITWRIRHYAVEKLITGQDMGQYICRGPLKMVQERVATADWIRESKLGEVVAWMIEETLEMDTRHAQKMALDKLALQGEAPEASKREPGGWAAWYVPEGLEDPEEQPGDGAAAALQYSSVHSSSDTSRPNSPERPDDAMAD